ncbi:MAG TPA: leucine zipper domain-containing protein [Vicinamibacterales bacterium]|jgi:putative transposase
MPWRETSPMEQRLEFVREYESGLFTMTELAAEYGISRKTGYKWLERYEADGALGMHDRSRRPHASPHATDAEVMAKLIRLRQRHPRWGAKKLLTIAGRRAPQTTDWPCPSTVAAHLKARGLITPRRRRQPPLAIKSTRAPITRANDVWTTDYKGEFLTGDGRYCYPLTLRDGFSRFVLRCDALTAHTLAVTRSRFERAFAEYGLPDRIRSDNGPPFGGTGLGRLSALAVWWIRLGIVPERIDPGHPEQNGSHEQFHRVLKADTARPPAATAAAQQRRFARFCTEYNHERPHEALDQAVPATRYQPSPRPFPRRLPSLEYPGHAQIRRVDQNGYVSWRRPLFVSVALADEAIAFEEIDDGIWTVTFATVVLGRLDERQHRIHPIAAISVGRSASSAGSAPNSKNDE